MYFRRQVLVIFVIIKWLCICLSLPQYPEYDRVENTGSCSRGNGRGYRGQQVQSTEHGIPCQAWNSQTPHRHPMQSQFSHELLGAGHACRNPGGLANQPWCYTSDPRVRWQYCRVTQCGELAMIPSIMCMLYR